MSPPWFGAELASILLRPGAEEMVWFAMGKEALKWMRAFRDAIGAHDKGAARDGGATPA
jgi:hypothetical protein